MKVGYKQTEVGVIPADWVVRQLGELATMVASGKSAAGRVTDDYPVHGSTGIIGYTATPEYEGDVILVARVGANAGRLNYVSGKYGVTDNAIIVRMNGGCFLPFFWRQLDAKRLNRLVFGSGQPLITGTQLKALPLAIPSLPEQCVIAAALSDVDALLSSLDALIAKKRDLKQAAMQQLLNGKTRLPGFSGKWGMRRLAELASIYQPQTIAANKFADSGYPVYGANGQVGFYHSVNHKAWQTTITCRGSTCGTVNRTEDNCWITGNAMVMNCDQTQNLDKEFFYHLLAAQDFTDCITGTGQPQIVRAPLAEFSVIIPPTKGEQVAIAQVLSGMDTELTALEAQRNKTRALKQGMMQELLTGRTRLV